MQVPLNQYLQQSNNLAGKAEPKVPELTSILESLKDHDANLRKLVSCAAGIAQRTLGYLEKEPKIEPCPVRSGTIWEIQDFLEALGRTNERLNAAISALESL